MSKTGVSLNALTIQINDGMTRAQMCGVVANKLGIRYTPLNPNIFCDIDNGMFIVSVDDYLAHDLNTALTH